MQESVMNEKYEKGGEREKQKTKVRFMAMTAMLSAVAFLLMTIEIPIPSIMPGFIKLDLSDLPELIGAFAMGPVWGVLICAVKNLLHLPLTQTSGVGELANFILGACFVIPGGVIYQLKQNKCAAVIGAVIGAVCMALISVVSNYFIVYPAYALLMPMDVIIGAYQAIYKGADTLIKCLVIFNMPFTFVKGMINVGLTLLIYKHISPIIKGRK